MNWYFLFLLIRSFSGLQQEQLMTRLQQGDIVFQNLTCGELCRSILAVTPCKIDKTFNHCGIIQVTDTGIFVLEAIDVKVQRTPIKSFLQRNANPVAFARVQGKASVSTAAVNRAFTYLDRPYDDAFLPGDSALYCSELIWECYEENGKKIFELQPMTFKAPGTDSTFAGWKNYYQALDRPVPEGMPGINPCGIANEPFLEWLAL